MTGETGPKAGLIRFVAGPDGEVVPDILGKLPGRGFYVTADRAPYWTQAAARASSPAPPSAPSRCPTTWRSGSSASSSTASSDLVALARKGGLAVAGFEKVKEALASRRGWQRPWRRSGAAAGLGRLGARQGQALDARGRRATSRSLPAHELGLAFGRDTCDTCRRWRLAAWATVL